MIRVYWLETQIVAGALGVKGQEFIHNAILNVDGILRKLIQDTTDTEHTGLVAVATTWREANAKEIDVFSKSGCVYKPPTVYDLPKSQHLARIKSIDVTKPKPVTVTRTYQGVDFDIPCIVTQDIKDQHKAGKIAVGDIVIVAYCEERYDQAIIQSKVFKSW